MTSSNRPTIRFAPGLRKVLWSSVGRLPPEHFAILAGRLDDPLRVPDVRPMPPPLDARGRPRATGASVTLNPQVIEYYLNCELLPTGKCILGAIHSHPGNYTSLSPGVAGSGEGDIPTMRAALERAAVLGKAWGNYLAPIVTNPGDNPTVTGWIVTLDSSAPIAADIVFEAEEYAMVVAEPNETRHSLWRRLTSYLSTQFRKVYWRQ